MASDFKRICQKSAFNHSVNISLYYQTTQNQPPLPINMLYFYISDDYLQLDALYPACVVLKEEQIKSSKIVDMVQKASQAARQGAESTSKMAARAGRASYVNPDNLHNPDPGAMAVSICFQAILDTLLSQI
ncbi:hypothetical protein LOTGIDRAFT_239582 [Lottia gigantea]|uniref:DhaL domain-containing protein n=1 Tax=Lottia gigantea TaxID=225164 RepID=V4A6D4_LOTGI|nr:hypothetical protein LOTGIDRAFT_239582 [Lottia gigantea]ESO92287.1 hypothetical protein LOTGIDRAFT_239582 [Lottia gigantea]